MGTEGPISLLGWISKKGKNGYFSPRWEVFELCLPWELLPSSGRNKEWVGVGSRLDPQSLEGPGLGESEDPLTAGNGQRAGSLGEGRTSCTHPIPCESESASEVSSGPSK